MGRGRDRWKKSLPEQELRRCCQDEGGPGRSLDLLGKLGSRRRSKGPGEGKKRTAKCWFWIWQQGSQVSQGRGEAGAEGGGRRSPKAGVGGEEGAGVDDSLKGRWHLEGTQGQGEVI